jgi:hypothetical protein
LVTLDGTDCPIQEPTDFESRWFSHKFKSAAVRYEVGICIQTGWIVWKNGPFPAGDWPDLKIGRLWVVHKLLADEKILADGGYADGNAYFETPTGMNNQDQKMKQVARARHETCNARIKQYQVLRQTYRHPLSSHMYCFHAVVNVIQLEIMMGKELFELKGNKYYCDNQDDAGL